LLGVVDAALSRGLEGVAQELPSGSQGVFFDPRQDLTGGSRPGEVVEFGQKESGLLERGEFGVTVAFKRERRHGEVLQGRVLPVPKVFAKI